MNLSVFKQENLFDATFDFFTDTLGIKLKPKSRSPIDLKSRFEDFEIRNKRSHQLWEHIDNTYYIGLLDDENFEAAEPNKTESLDEDLQEVDQSSEVYPGILVFAVDAKDSLNATRTNLSEITRTLNRLSNKVPALALVRYNGKLSFMLAERVPYKQQWREGERVRKISVLRDIDPDNTHAGHLRILDDLVIPTSGTKKVASFDELYEYWQRVLDTSELNKKFYQELSNWYFWAIKHVRFPDEPTLEDAHEQDKEHEDMLHEHRATNVIRLLTRLLFVWFIKEKGLIPEELFDLPSLQKDILNDITPNHHKEGMFKEASKESIFYKAILQNLFFSTLNCPIEASEMDNRQRGFRRGGGNYGVTFLMRYEKYFKDRDAFLELMNSKVPFLNGGLFECLDVRGEKEDKEDRVWVDGFSDNLPNKHHLVVPDYLFFGVEEHVDLSADYGLKRKKYKEAAVKGLLNIFGSYKFTVTENTPIEEDVALDPELLGKVFENLLASYNPETKTTARKQTGSFYTPREIVNYMVDESLIAYLKNSINDWGEAENELDDKLHRLASYEPTIPFEENDVLRKEIITALGEAKILDPACGSGAFPMGILQKMVHILRKLDPDNAVWKTVQKERAKDEANKAITEITDKDERGQRLQEINEAFDQRINAPDYARKLFLVENCIYGVDIQPMAAQISKLRFFISLVVEQKVGLDPAKNFGIRPLPNLETKFITANTLIDIEKSSGQMSLYETDTIKELENRLKAVRSKLFGARTTKTKYKHRQKDEQLRNQIAEELKQTGWPNETADKLANWDPYDQNASSPFFNPEWMFDVSDGFDVVLGNPPYVFTRDVDFKVNFKKYVKENYFNEIKKTKKSRASQTGKINLFAIFILKALKLAKENGSVTYILPNNILRTTTYSIIRKYILLKASINQIVDLGSGIFENVTASTILFHIQNQRIDDKMSIATNVKNLRTLDYDEKFIEQKQFLNNVSHAFNIYLDERGLKLSNKIKSGNLELGELCKDIIEGIVAHKYLIKSKTDKGYVPLIEGKDIGRFNINEPSNFLKWEPDEIHRTRSDYIWETSPKIIIQRISGGKKPLVCAIDHNQFKSFASTNNLILKANYTEYYEYICALINSDVINWFYANNFSNNSELTVNISKTFLEILPIPFKGSESLFKPLVKMIGSTESGAKEFKILDDVINAMAFEVYFKEHMEEEGIDILAFVEQDLSNLMQGREFEELSNSEKETVIGQLSAIWSNPENEVRKRINSFPEKSPDILKPIIEA